MRIEKLPAYTACEHGSRTLVDLMCDARMPQARWLRFTTGQKAFLVTEEPAASLVCAVLRAAE